MSSFLSYPVALSVDLDPGGRHYPLIIIIDGLFFVCVRALILTYSGYIPLQRNKNECGFLSQRAAALVSGGSLPPTCNVSATSSGTVFHVT